MECPNVHIISLQHVTQSSEAYEYCLIAAELYDRIPTIKNSALKFRDNIEVLEFGNLEKFRMICTVVITLTK